MYARLVLIEKEDKEQNKVLGCSGLMLNEKYVITTGNILLQVDNQNIFENLEPGKLYTELISTYRNATVNTIWTENGLYVVKKARIFATFISGNIKDSSRHVFKNWAIDSIDNNTNLAQSLSLFFILSLQNIDGIDDLKNVLKEWWYLVAGSDFIKGEPLCSRSVPFGNRNFIDSYSRGIVSNIFGNNSCLILSDCPSTPGSEGSPVYIFNSEKCHFKYPLGLILASLSWWKGEWVGLTLIADIKSILLELIDIPIRTYNITNNVCSNIVATTEFSLVQVYCGNNWGTAILLNKEKGIFITNSHVIVDNKIQLFHKQRSWNANLIYRTQENNVLDLALIKSEIYTGKAESSLKPVNIKNNKYNIGDTVYATGYSLFAKDCDPSPILTKGIISQLNSFMLKTTCSVHPGASGGAILDYNGNFLGVIVCNIKLNENNVVYPRVNVAIPFLSVSDTIFKYIETEDLTILNNLNVTSPEAEDAWKKLENFQCYNMLLQLKVIVWKNLIIRKRHWILTVLESLLPILLFLLIAYGRSKITGLQKTEVKVAQYYDPNVISYDGLSVNAAYIYFTPNNEFYQDIIKRTQIKFDMYNNNIKGFDSSKALLQYYANHNNDTVVAIIFHEKGPKEFDYTIRYNDGSYDMDLDTSKLYKNQFQFSPDEGTSYYWRGLISIQKALDMSFIEKSYGKDLENNITIKIQQFPYPPHTSDSAINTIFNWCLPLITIFSFIFLCPAVLKRVVEEKYTGIKELLKMVGMKSWMLWLGWFIYGMIPLLFSIICIVILMKVPLFGTDYPPIEYSDGSVLFVFLLLYCMAAVVFCFAISSFFSKPTIAMVIGILVWILSYFVPKYAFGLEESSNNISWGLGMFLMFLPNMALHYGYAAISSYEERDIGIQWYNFNKGSSDGTNDITMLNVFLMLLLNVVVYMSFTFYMDGINPGKYGVRRSVLFPIHSLIKVVKMSIGKSDVQNDAESTQLGNIEEGHHLKKGIEIKDLCKRFGHKQAVSKLSLDIYQNQITVLLGHNGAGKSTTMSMITGMIDITSGCVKMNGVNIKHNMDELRKNLGLCPQHNLLFTDLTVGEHLQFFARLKGKTEIQAKQEMESILKILNLSEKTNSMANTLSGGMKRKLCLGMAIIGGSNILILDEPTSGMDPESRRELWDLLLSWRGEKTILITTHFMEEADALGDWIAIMANGSLQCHGTPMYLKKKYDTGYHLSLVVDGSATKEEKCEIKRNIINFIPDAQFKDMNGNNMVFVLPFENNMKISDLLSFLEDTKDDLKIENISVTVTTLEDVFLKAKSEFSPEESKEDALDSTGFVDSTQPFRNLMILRICALIMKKLEFCKKKAITYLVPTLIASVFFFLTIYLSRNGSDFYRDNGSELKLKLDVYKETGAFYNGSGNDVVDNIKRFYKRLVENNEGEATEISNVQDAIIDTGIKNIVYYKKHLVVSAEFRVGSEIEAIALYNVIALHSAPISLNLVTNAVAKALLGEEYSISASSWLLPTINSDSNPEEYSEMKVGILWLIMIPIGCLFIIGSFIVFPHMELSTKFAQLQYMCGVKPYIYWSVNFVVDMILYMVIITVLALSLMMSTPFIGIREFGVLMVIFFMYGIAAIPYTYLFSRKTSASGAFSLFIISGIFLGIILTVVVGVLIETRDDYYVNIGNWLKAISMILIPQYALTHSGLDFCRKAVQNYNMQVMSKMKSLITCSSFNNPCCPGHTADECEKFKSYWPLLQTNFAYMFISCVLFLMINLLWDSYLVKKYTSKVIYKLKNLTKKSIGAASSQHTQKPNNYNTLNARNLQKTYSGKQIVKNIGFSLNNGECLGILGVNGAGKTTTFRMLTREEIVDEGTVEIQGEHGYIDFNQDEYLEKLGYCPQSDALNFVLTGRQILRLIAQLRGIEDPEVVNLFLKMFELEEYADIPCGHYSGGNKRKLSLAVALIGYPKYVLLDEPTNGVDPSSRRKFWTLIKRVQEKKRLAFILTSHSMTECEALCNNLKIMKNGKFEKEGTISELKKEYGGFSIKLKLTKKDNLVSKNSILEHTGSSRLNDIESYDEVDSVPLIKKEDVPHFDTVTEMKEYFINYFAGEVKDEHSGLLHFYIKDKTKKWSAIFKEVEKIKKENSHLIEDYAISEASLEDIFLSVARSGDIEEIPKKKKRKFGRKSTNTI